MVTFEIDFDSFLTEHGVEVSAFTDSDDVGSQFKGWSTLVDELVGAYSVPNHRGKLMLNNEDFLYLKRVASGMMDAADYLDERIEEANVI